MSPRAYFKNVIKYEGEPDVLIYHHPIRDFNTKSTIQIQPTQEAFFYENNQLIGHFTSGAEQVATQNYPILSSLSKPFHGGELSNTADVYFINKLEQSIEVPVTDCKFIDPAYPLVLTTGFCTTIRFTINDPLQLLLKAAGTADSFTKDDLLVFIKNTLQGKLNTAFSVDFRDYNHLYDFFRLETSKPRLNQVGVHVVTTLFSEYGMAVTYFNVDSVAPQDENDEDYRRYKELRYQSIKKIEVDYEGVIARLRAMNEAEVARVQQTTQQDLDRRQQEIAIELKVLENQQLGLTEKEQIAFRIAEVLAGNPGVAGVGTGVGAMAGMYSAGVALTPYLTNALNNIGITTQNVTPKVGGPPVSYFGVPRGVGMTNNGRQQHYPPTKKHAVPHTQTTKPIKTNNNKYPDFSKLKPKDIIN